MEEEAKKEQKELKKVQTIAKSYYSRKDIQKAIYEFCKHREVVPRYLEGFGKRPDCLDYASDIFNLAKKGATSFHCSEELWDNPLDIKTEMTPAQYNELRIGWDFLIDIDSKYLDYSKIAAELLIKALEHHGIRNYGIKFSGSKGFHIIIPFKAFPKEINENETKNFFPEYARLIAGYLSETVKPEITKEILNLSTKEDIEKTNKNFYKMFCKKCGNQAQQKTIGKYKCPNFKCKSIVDSMKSNRKEIICQSCNSKMQRISKQDVFICENCKINSLKNINSFEKKANLKQLIDTVDIILVAPRHLFRAPYSLHEKTALASIVIDKTQLANFKPADAEPFKIKNTKPFIPESQEAEAKELLSQALDWAQRKQAPSEKTNYTGKSIDVKGLKITEDMFPQIIKKLLEGIKEDGRKRALYILLGFHYSLEFPDDYIREKIFAWNQKNTNPLPESYLSTQLEWFKKNKPMPPNYDKPIYREFNIPFNPEPGIKNPINYTIKQALKSKIKKP